MEEVPGAMMEEVLEHKAKLSNLEVREGSLEEMTLKVRLEG